MGKIIFITGGARSGKSRFAADLAKKAGPKVVFIATCVPQDDEMKHRVKLHINSRPKSWKTIEELKSLPTALYKVPLKTDAVIVECADGGPFDHAQGGPLRPALRFGAGRVSVVS